MSEYLPSWEQLRYVGALGATAVGLVKAGKAVKPYIPRYAGIHKNISKGGKINLYYPTFTYRKRPKSPGVRDPYRYQRFRQPQYRRKRYPSYRKSRRSYRRSYRSYTPYRSRRRYRSYSTQYIKRYRKYRRSRRRYY